MTSPDSAQLDLARRYARELRRMNAEARDAFRRNELSIRRAAKNLTGEVTETIGASARDLTASVTSRIPPAGNEIAPEPLDTELTPGAGHA